MFDTKPPLNINDSDFTADMIEPPPERQEATELTFCLIRCEVLRVVRKTAYLPSRVQSPDQPANILSLPDRIAQVKDLEERLQTHYFKNCDTADPFFQLCATVARLIVARSWLFVYYPLIQENDRTKLPAGVRDQFF
jgi:hypothetical protein